MIVAMLVAMAAGLIFFALCIIFVGVVFFGMYLYHRYHGEYKKWAIVIANIFLSLGSIVLAPPTAFLVFIPMQSIIPDWYILVTDIIYWSALVLFVAGIVGLFLVRSRTRKGKKVGNVGFSAVFVTFYLGLSMCLICASPFLLFLLE